MPPLKFAQLVGLSSPSSAPSASPPARPLLGVVATAVRAGRRVPQRGLRHLPGLPALPARRPPPARPRTPPDLHNTKQPKGSTPWHAPTSWSPPTGPRAISTPPTSSSSRSTRTPAPTTAATSPAPSSWTGGPICRTRSSATSSTPQQFSKLLSDKGIANDDTVILYGGNNNWFAAYAYWYFKLYGHDDVKLLDGGRKKWELDGRPLSTDTVSRPATSYTAAAPDNTIRAFRDEVIAAIGVKNLVDVRSPDEFSGKILAPAHLPQEQSQRPGHIPGAINVPWSKAANEDGTFKSDEDLAKLYADAGLDGDKETIAYCRIGERSSHTWFVLQELLGHKNVKNYDGSWTEYGSLVGAPIELGS